MSKSYHYVTLARCVETALIDGVQYRCTNGAPEGRPTHKGYHANGGVVWGEPKPVKPPQPPSAKEIARRLAAMNPGAHLPAAPTSLQRAVAGSGNASAFMAGANYIIEALKERADALIDHPNDELFYAASDAYVAALELLEGDS